MYQWKVRVKKKKRVSKASLVQGLFNIDDKYKRKSNLYRSHTGIMINEKADQELYEKGELTTVTEIKCITMQSN